MSVGLFSKLPTDIINTVWSYFDPETLASAAKVCRTFRSRADSEELWKAEAMKFLDFNTVLEFKHISNLIPIQRDKSPRVMNAVFFLKTRYDNLDSCRGYFHERRLTDEEATITWKFVFHALAYFFQTRHLAFGQPTSLSHHALHRVAHESTDPAKVTAAVQALCTIKYDCSHNQFKLCLKNIFPDKAVLPLLMENFFLYASNKSGWPEIWKICSRVNEPSMFLWMLQHEKQEYDDISRTSDGLMYEYNHIYITETLGPTQAFEILVAQVEIQDLVDEADGFEIERIFKVAKTLDDDRVTPLVRAICVLLIHLTGLSDRIVSELLGYDADSFVEKTVSRSVESSRSQPLVMQQLYALRDNSQVAPRTRILATHILIKLGVDPLSFDLSNIPGYPHPWNGPVPLPQDVREAILRYYANSFMGPGTDPSPATASPNKDGLSQR